jgi:hypothetical protein
MLLIIIAISGTYPNIAINLDKYIIKKIFKYHQHFFPFGRADLTASASLQPIRGSSLQLHRLLPCQH